MKKKQLPFKASMPERTGQNLEMPLSHQPFEQ
jgi:hypothetical protein